MKMFSNLKWAITLFVFAVIMLAWSVMGQDAPPTETPPAEPFGTGLLMVVIPVISTVLVFLFKWVFPKLPKASLPIIAPIVGWLIDVVSTAMGGPDINPVLAAALGSTGVGLREIADQLSKSTGMKAASKVAGVLLLSGLLAGSVVITGCQTTPTTTYKVSSGAHVTAKAALGAWNEYIATHDVSVETETKVRDAYRSYQSAQLIVLDAAIAIKDWQSAGGADNDALNAKFTQATTTAAQAFSDLLTLLINLGVKL